VQYLEMQFEVLFCRGDSQASYLFLDKHLFGAKSGYHGDMFPPEKLGAVIAAVASDIRREYGSILSGNEARWADIQRLIAAPPVRRKLP
jgi:hypothetical protein